MDYMRYSRDVIVLEEKNREFADRPGEEMKGYLRVETGNNRGAFRCVVQNVKYYPRSEYTYRLILFGKRGERTIHTVVGTVPVNRFAAGEVYLRFHPNDVDGQGNDYGRYTTAIIAAVSSKNRTEPLHPVLMGRTGHEITKDATQSRVSAMTAATPAPPGSVSAQGLPKAPTLLEPVPSPESKTQSERSRRKTYTHYYAEYLKHVCQYLWSVPGYYQEVRPFRSEAWLEGVRWMKVADPAVMFLVSPGAKHFTDRYGHFLLGRSSETGGDALEIDGENTENGTFYVAVPGRSEAEDQPDGGESGFRLWIPLATEGESRNESGSNKENYGYWLLGIDGNTGEIFSCEDL